MEGSQPLLGLRVDVDTAVGYEKGVPKLLRLFRDQNITASFCVTTGSDNTSWNVIRYLEQIRKVSHNQSKARPRTKQSLKLILANKKWFVRSFLANNHFTDVEKRLGLGSQILDQGHDLFLHGYNHFSWANYFSTYPPKKQREFLYKGIKKFEEMYHQRPTGFASPNFVTTPVLLMELKKQNFLACSNFTTEISKVPFKPHLKDFIGVMEVPVLRRTLLELASNNCYPSTGVVYLHASVEGLSFVRITRNYLKQWRVALGGQVGSINKYLQHQTEQKDTHLPLRELFPVKFR